MADAGSVDQEAEIFATSLDAPDADRLKVVEQVEGFSSLADPVVRNGRVPLFLILEAGQNAGP
ncbi:MAG: hypothetical protein U5K76_12315 [Woeseiaceae bacterium]|nr:hypothetical protein [Woeseiaceae bacterium]